MSEETLSQDQRTRFRPLIFILAGSVVLLWLIAWYLITLGFTDLAQRGQFGDMFGAVNSLFTGLAFAGIILTILLQREELVLQRQELGLTRDQLARSAEAQEKSERSFAKQAQSLETSARLNALASVIESLQITIVQHPTASVREIAERDRFRYITRLSKELDSLMECSAVGEERTAGELRNE